MPPVLLVNGIMDSLPYLLMGKGNNLIGIEEKNIRFIEKQLI